MFPYWLMFGVVAAGALQFGGQARPGAGRFVFVLIAVAITLMIGLRYQVGGDWYSYNEIYQFIYFLNFNTVLRQPDLGYALMNWTAARIGADVWFANLICAAIFMTGVARLSLRQPSPFLALLVAIPYLVIVVAMGYTRQAAAIGFICMGLAATQPNRMIKVGAAILLAMFMHRASALALFIFLVPIFRQNVLTAVVGGGAFVGVAFLVLRDSADRLVTNYVSAAYDSQGALIRVSMNVVAAVIFLMFRRHFKFDAFERNYWTISSLLSLVSLVALYFAVGTTGIDRAALFLIPLQIVVLARLPYIGIDGQLNRVVLLGVVAYSLMVQAVWLLYATHAEYWVPYRSMLGVWTD